MRLFSYIRQRINQTLLAGILVGVPLVLTAFLFFKLWTWVDVPWRRLFHPGSQDTGWFADIGRWLQRQGVNLEFLDFPGAGLVAIVTILLVTGVAGRTFLGRRILRLGDRIVEKIPVARTVYLGARQLFESLLAGGEAHFEEVVLIEYPRRGIWIIGFVTGTTASEIRNLTNDNCVNVFVPTTPNPTSGFLLMVPKQDLNYLNLSVEEGVKLVISGGIVNPAWKEAKRVDARSVDEALPHAAGDDKLPDTAVRQQSEVKPS